MVYVLVAIPNAQTSLSSHGGVGKSCCIEGLNCVNTMPPWWMTTHWRKQYPKGTHVLCDFDMEKLRLALPDTSYKYCPPYEAPNKAGCPKKRTN